MLVLTRNAGEKIIIGDMVEVVFLGFNGKNGVKLGFKAPIDIAINREEIYNKIKGAKDE